MSKKSNTPSVDELLDISMRESWTNDNVSGSTRERSVRRIVEDWNSRKDHLNNTIRSITLEEKGFIVKDVVTNEK